VATKIRLARYGRKKRPFYRIVVADSRSPRDGRHIEKIGYYDPLTEPITLKIDKQKALYWLNNGAIPTRTTKNLLSIKGLLLEWDLRKSGKTEEVIEEELQKFEFLREQKAKIALEKKEIAAKEKEVPAEPEETESEASIKAESDTGIVETEAEPDKIDDNAQATEMEDDTAETTGEKQPEDGAAAESDKSEKASE